MNRFVECKAINFYTLQVYIYHPNKDVDYIFTLVTSNEKRFRIFPRVIAKREDFILYEFNLEREIELGYDYHIAITHLGIYPLNVNPLASLKEFDDRFYYDGDDLGFTYSRKETSFALWAPLASSVILYVDNKKAYKMIRSDKGVYRYTIKKNIKNSTYHYYVTNSGVTTRTLDPYGKASTINSKENVVLDFKQFIRNMHPKHPPKHKSYLDAIIYEGHVRDLTIDPNTNIEHKGTFLGLAEEGKVNKDGMPVGFDYIKSLGITHLQLLPIYDYLTTDEANPKDTYNWGYDPAQYFVPEGGYASDVNDPSSRIKDLLTLVSKYHAAGIRIIMDVVFNHVYEHQYSSFEAVVPNYFFRRKEDGSYFNASGCGNDFASERKMARKLIVDVCKWWVSFYHIDGFRFDLMGLIDIDTMNLIKQETYKIRQDLTVYGEGWVMDSGYNLTLANTNNYNCIPCVSFFNDTYRDFVVGNPNSKTPGYGLNNSNYHEQFKECFSGCSFNLLGPSKFDHPSCSINFVECHDNNTLYDKISIIAGLDKDNILKRVNFINQLVMFSLGVPFFHAGQEIGLSKNNHGNTYNAGDAYNMFDYSLLKDRQWMVDSFKKMCEIRKRYSIFHELNKNIIDKNVGVCDLDNNAIVIKLLSRIKKDRSYHKIYFIINPNDCNITYDNIDIEGVSVKIVEDYK